MICNKLVNNLLCRYSDNCWRLYIYFLSLFFPLNVQIPDFYWEIMLFAGIFHHAVICEERKEKSGNKYCCSHIHNFLLNTEYLYNVPQKFYSNL